MSKVQKRRVSPNHTHFCTYLYPNLQYNSFTVVPNNSTFLNFNPMYSFEIEIGINSKFFFKTITADSHKEALEFASMMYPEANYIELV